MEAQKRASRTDDECLTPVKRRRKGSLEEITESNFSTAPMNDKSPLAEIPNQDLSNQEASEGYVSDNQMRENYKRRAGLILSGKRRTTGGTFSAESKKSSNRVGIRRPGEIHHFLLGGNSRDPLNLKNVKPDDPKNPEFNRPIEVIIPKNVRDPLNLLSMPKLDKRKKKRKNKKKGKDELTEEMIKQNQIVSPVVVQRRFPSSRQASSSVRNPKIANETSQKADSPKPGTSSAHVSERTFLGAKVGDEKGGGAVAKRKQEKMADRYRYGNFNNYYHREQTLGDQLPSDPRIDIFCGDWFRNKTVLDIGCNSGLFTISLARRFQPRLILGIDIDHHLVGAARKNIRHFCDKETKLVGKFPASFGSNFGPISVTSTSYSSEFPLFPDNIWFKCENYVLESDAKLAEVHEQYDNILAINVVKYIHLNWGDAGLKRFFKRAFQQLRTGGRFILETETFDSYRRRYRKMTVDSKRIFENLTLFPDDFYRYLLSKEIGFSHHEELDTPMSKEMGWSGRLQVFYKGQFMIQEFQ